MVTVPPPAKQIPKPVVPSTNAVLLFIQAAVLRSFYSRNGLPHRSPEVLLPVARILPDSHSLFDGCGVGKNDVVMAPVLNHPDSAARVASLLAWQSQRDTNRSQKCQPDPRPARSPKYHACAPNLHNACILPHEG